MSGNPQRDIENLVERIRNPEDPDDEIPPADREVLLKLHAELERLNNRENKFGDHHHRDTLGDCYRIARHTGSLAETLSEDSDTQNEAIETILDWIASRNPSPYVSADYRSALRIFGDILVDKSEHPSVYDRFKDIDINARNTDHDPTPMPSEILTWKEVVTVADTKEQYNLRDPALIAVQWAGGFRPMSELWDLTVDQIDDEGDRILITVAEDAKTGTRDVVLYAGAPYLRRWLANHPWRDDPDRTYGPDTPVWVATRGDYEQVSYTAFKEVFYDAANRAGIEKPFNPQNLRRSRASILAAGVFMSQAQLENFFGWVRGSRAAAHYVARFAGETHKMVGMHDGALNTEEEDEDPIAPVPCPDCDRYTPRHRDRCIWCPAEINSDLSDPHPQFRDKIIADEGETLLDLIADDEITAADLQSVKKLEPVIRSRNSFFDRLDDYIALAERIDNGDSQPQATG